MNTSVQAHVEAERRADDRVDDGDLQETKSMTFLPEACVCGDNAATRVVAAGGLCRTREARATPFGDPFAS
jgi:hypothetical protein